MVLARARALSLRRGELAGDAVLASGSSVLATGIAAITSIVIARELGPTDRGVWAVLVSLAAIVSTVIPLGLPFALGYGLAQETREDRPALARAGFVAAVIAAIGAGLVAFLIAFVAEPGGVSPGLALLAGAIAAVLVVHHVGQQATLTATTLRTYVAVQLTPVVAMFAAIIAIAIAGRLTVTITAIASGASTLLAATVAVAALSRAGLLGRPPTVTAAAHRLRPYVGFAVLTFGTLSLTQIVHRIDLLIVDGYLGARETGLYAVAVQLSDVLLVVPAALGAVVFRRGATGAERHFDDALLALRYVGALSLAVAVAVGLAAPSLVDVLFGDGYASAVAPLRWLLPGVVLLGLQSVASNYVASRGRPRAVLLAWLAAAVFSVLADLVVIPAHGIEGAAVVSSLSYMLVLGLHVPVLRALRP